MKCRSCGQPEDLFDRVLDVREWAASRIEWCRGEENRLGVGGIGIYEAAQERRTLQAVLRQLNGDPTPIGSTTSGEGK